MQFLADYFKYNYIDTLVPVKMIMGIPLSGMPTLLLQNIPLRPFPASYNASNQQFLNIILRIRKKTNIVTIFYS